MRSDAIDQLVSTYLKQPAKVSWKGALGDSVRGVFQGGRIELAGISVLALPFDRIVVQSDRFQFTPGLPASIEITRPRIELSIDQRQMNRWLKRARAPFELELTENGFEFHAAIAGISLNRTLSTLEVRSGWLVLKPVRSEVLGLNTRLATLFRSYLPIPRLAPGVQLTRIRHAKGAVRLQLTLDDFDEQITPGLVDRLRSRFYPFARKPSDLPRS